MAENSWSNPFDDAPATDEGNHGDWSWADPVKHLASGVAGQAAGWATGAQLAAERNGSQEGATFFKDVANLGEAASDAAKPSKAYEAAAEASPLTKEGRDEITSHPFVVGLANITGLAPGFILPAIGGAAAGPAGMVLAGGVDNAAQAARTAIGWTNKLDDTELAKASPVYRELVDQFSQQYDDPDKVHFEARRALHEMQYSNYQALVQGGIGGVASGVIGHTILGGAAKTFGKGAALGVAETSVGTAALGGGGDYARQSGQIGAGAQESYDIDSTLQAGLDSGLKGGILGGITGGYHGAMAPADKVKPPKAKDGVTTTNEAGVDADTKTALGESAPAARPSTSDAENVGASNAAAGEPAAAPPPTTQEVTTPPAGGYVDDQRFRDLQQQNAERAQRGAEPAKAPGDSELQKEPPAQLQAQQDQLANGEGDRSAVMYPKGEGLPKDPPEGMKRFKWQENIYDYDPAKTSAKDIKAAIKDGTIGKLLGLGDTKKSDAMQDVANGAQPAAVQERNSEGTPVREAVGTADTVPAQVKHFEKTKAPGSTVEATTPEAVLNERATATQNAPSAPETTPPVTPVNPAGEERNIFGLPKGQSPTGPKVRVRVDQLKENDVVLYDGQRPGRVVGTKTLPDGKVSVTIDHGTGVSSVELNADQQVTKKSVVTAEKPPIPQRVVEEATAPLPEHKAPENDNKPRVLEDQSAASKKAAAEWDAHLAENAKREKALEKEQEAKATKAERDLARENGQRVESTAKRSKAENAAIAEREEKAQGIFKEHAPDEDENKSTYPLKPVGLDAIIARLQRIVDAAKEHGIPLEGTKTDKQGQPYQYPLQVTTRVGNHTAYLYVVRDTLAALKKAKAEHKLGAAEAIIHKFKPDELMGHAGEFGPMLERRKQEGDQAMRREQSLEGKADTGVEVRHEIGSSIDHEVTTGAHEDEHIGRQHDELADDKSLEKNDMSEREVGAPLEGREREVAPKAAAITEADIVKGTDKAGTFQVAKKRNIQIPGKGKPNIKASINHKYEDGYVAPGKVFIGGRYFEPKATYTARELLSKLGEFNNTVHGRMQRHLIEAIEKRIPDFKIHVMSDGQMDVAQGRGTQGYHFIGSDRFTGEQWPEMSHVVMRASHFDADGKITSPKGKHTAVHELVHALTTFEINNNHKFRGTIEKLMAEVLAVHPEEKYDAKTGKGSYGLSDAHEFIAEAMTNPTFQSLLEKTKISKELGKELDIGRHWSVTSMWKGLVEAVRKLAPGIKPEEFTALEAAMRATELNVSMQDVGKMLGTYNKVPDKAPAGVQALKTPFKATDKVMEKIKGEGIDANNVLRKAADKLSTFHQLGERARETFGGKNNPIEKVAQLIEQQRVKAHEIKEPSVKLYTEFADKERQYKKTGDWQKFVELSNDAQRVNYDPSNPHSITGDKSINWQLEARKADLDQRFKALPNDLKDLYKRSVEHFSDLHERESMGKINNIIQAALGHDDPGLAQRIYDGAATTADHDLFKTDRILKNLNDAAENKRRRGYFPQMRRGDFVVNGRHDIGAIPQGAIKVGDNTVRFHGPSETAARRAAHAYAEAHDLDMIGDARHITVDKNDPTQRVEPQHLDAEHAFDVRLQTQHTEMVDHESQARELADKLKSMGLKDTSYTTKREASSKGGLASHELAQIAKDLQARKGFKDMTPEQQNDVVQAMNEATMRLRGGVYQRKMFRANVKGASKDITRNVADYTSTMSRHLSAQEFKPQIDEALKAARDYAEANKLDGNRNRRDEILNEADRRVHEPAVRDQHTIMAKLTNRIVQATYLGKLASPAFHIINSLEPWTTSIPIIAGRHGFMKTTAEMAKAYDVIGGLKNLGAGFKDTGKALRSDTGFTDYLHEMQTRAKTFPDGQRLADMLQHLHATGLLDREANMEIERHANPSGNAMGRALDRMDLMSRQLGVAVESNNRAASAIAAYRLEYKELMNDEGLHADPAKREQLAHQKAMKYAHDVVDNGMGNYSGTNASPVFNSNAGKMMLQFRKFAQKTYYLLGKSAKGMINGDKEATKTFIGLMATHMLAAGALGLPLEPIKVALTASGVLGSGYWWGDFEDNVREYAEKAFGAKFGEIFTRGISRAIPGGFGFDLSSRMGLDSLLSGPLEPNSDKANDVKAYLFNLLAGAGANTVLDAMQGLKMMASGNILGGAAKAIPMKVGADALTAAQRMQQGKVSKSGRETMAPYSPQEAVIKTLGLNPQRDAETSARQGAAIGDQKQYAQQRNALSQAWVLGKGADRAKAMIAIKKWNEDQPEQSKLTLKDLQSAEKRRANDGGSYVDGIRVNKRDRHLVEAKKFYNYK